MSIPSPALPDDPFFQYALDSAALVAHTDAGGTITYVNDKFCEISGYTQEELLGSNHRILWSGVHDAAFFREMYHEITNGRTWHGEICNSSRSGALYWVDTTIVPHLSVAGNIDSYTTIRFDITGRKQLEEALRASRARLAKITGSDTLTGLPNRERFQNYLEALVTEHKKTGRGFHLGMLDVDSFKEINELFGHSAGDLLLKTISHRMRAASGEHAFLSRIGADEFALVVAGFTDCDAMAYFERMLDAIRRPIDLGSLARRCSASIGIAAYPEHAADAEYLIVSASLALSRAKVLGRDRIENFETKLREMAERKAIVLEEIENGLAQHEFVLHYQPIVSIVEPDRISLEALLRWQHPQQGLLTPSYFSAGLEDQGVRAALGMFVLQQVFQDIASLHSRGLQPWRVGINLTNSEFRSDAFIDRFFEQCAETGIHPSHFCMEVTEGMFLGYDQKRVASGLKRLHDGGVEVALDDFGTGYASLTHLRRLPTDRLKIDKSFVANMTIHPEDKAIVRGIIDIAHSLKKTVTAEGVETREQVDLLRDMKCDLLQGWYFAKACAVDQLPETLAAMPQV